MDPFDNYHSDEEDQDDREDEGFEVSPLVPMIPPMPEQHMARQMVPSVPTMNYVLYPSNAPLQQVVLLRRDLDDHQAAHGFIDANQEFDLDRQQMHHDFAHVVFQPSQVHHVSEIEAGHQLAADSYATSHMLASFHGGHPTLLLHTTGNSTLQGPHHEVAVAAAPFDSDLSTDLTRDQRTYESSYYDANGAPEVVDQVDQKLSTRPESAPSQQAAGRGGERGPINSVNNPVSSGHLKRAHDPDLDDSRHSDMEVEIIDAATMQREMARPHDSLSSVVPTVAAVKPTPRSKISASAASSLTPDKLSAIRNIVTGSVSPAKTIQSAKKSAPNLKGNAKESKPKVTEDEDDDEDGAEPDKKKRKVLKPVRKVLVAKKELDFATQFLSDKDDLLSCLSVEDCMFLGKNFWIFTVAQLKSVLLPDNMGLEGEALEKALEVRDQLVAKLSEKTDSNEEGGSDKGKGAPGVVASVQGDDPLPSNNKTDREDADTMPYSKSGEEKATDHVTRWTQILKEYAGDENNKLSLEKRFPFDGPINCLLPRAISNFFASVPLLTLYEFFRLKKTETGAVIDFECAWRERCGLTKLSHLSLAKHLLGIANRIELALAAVPPVDTRSRKWMNDPIIALTGAAREFLVDDQGILSAHEFIETRTKDLSIELEAWRIRRGLVPLKGSGKVAMVSGWKAAAREHVEAELNPGRVLHDVDLKKMVELEIPVVNQESEEAPVESPAPAPSPVVVRAQKEQKVEKKAAARKKAPSTIDRQAEYALHSRLLLEDVLGEEIADFLASVGVNTAAELFKSKAEPNSTLASALLEKKRASKMSECSTLLDDWCEQLQAAVDQMRRPVPAIAPTSPAKTAPPKPAINVETSKSRRVGPVSMAEPFEALSLSTQVFLRSIGISTAAEFLSSRTTDVAHEFVKWRMQEGKPELKGLGAIASVSGWKAQCRKAAKAMGLDELATLEPANKLPPNQGTGAMSLQPTDLDAKQKCTMDTPISDKYILGGKTSVFFHAQRKDGEKHFRFELSLRRPIATGVSKLFITYKGAGRRCDDANVLSSADIFKQVESWSGITMPSMPVLTNILTNPKLTLTETATIDQRAPFAIDFRDCGLIDLSSFGVRPLERQDLKRLQTALKEFVFSKEEGSNADDSDTEERPNAESESQVAWLSSPFMHNVIVEKPGNSLRKYYFCASRPMEKGQTVLLSFPSYEVSLRSDRFRGSKYQRRHQIDESLQLLSMSDLREILSTLKEMSKSVRGNKSADNETESKRKIHWISRRLVDAMNCSLTEADRDSLTELRYDLDIEGRDYFMNELHAAIEYDPVCGDEVRRAWCASSLNFFDDLSREPFSADFSSGWSTRISCHLDKALDFKVHRFEIKKKADKTTMARIQQTYSDALELCCETLQPFNFPEVIDMVACEDPDSASSVVWRRSLELHESLAPVSLNWYKSQMLEIARVLARTMGFLWTKEERSVFKFDTLVSSLDHINSGQSKKFSDVHDEKPSTIRLRLPPPASIAKDIEYQPHAIPFFLGIIWPVLREQGWRLDAGSSPDEVTFYPPSTKPQHRKSTAFVKQQRDRKRARLAREVNKLGLGIVPKVAKRVFGNVARVHDLTNDTVEPSVPTVSARKVFGQFSEWIKNSLDEGDSDGRSRAERMVDAYLECFEAVASSLTTKLVDQVTSSSDTYGCDVLLDFILILPMVLPQCNISLEQMNDCMESLQDLLWFVTSRHEELLDQKFQPPKEVYKSIEREAVSSVLVRRLVSRRPPSNDKLNETSGKETLTEIVLDVDRSDLTDFVVSVMEQTIPCRATEDDASKKFRRIHVGFPGLMCRHCTGSGGEGRYFFSSVDSLTTASTVIEKHLVKCPSVPPEVKARVISSKSRHSDQRKLLPSGAQQAFFTRLWERLKSSQIGTRLPRDRDVLNYGAVSNSDLLADGLAEGRNLAPLDALEFTDHVAILKHVKESTQFKTDKDIQEAFDQYYSCLDYGGRIYYTTSMPKHFSAEWLLTKIVPKRYEYEKVRIFQG